jgi:hypothetical protein
LKESYAENWKRNSVEKRGEHVQQSLSIHNTTNMDSNFLRLPQEALARTSILASIDRS